MKLGIVEKKRRKKKKKKKKKNSILIWKITSFYELNYNNNTNYL